MPAGALWTLRYYPTVDGRILARSDAARLRADEFVQNVVINITRDSCVVVVQFHDDQRGPYDDRLRREIETWISQPSETQGSTDPPTLNRDGLISLARGTPIQRCMKIPVWDLPIRRNRDYTAVARRIFLVEEIPEVVSDSPYAESHIDQVNLVNSIARLIKLTEELQPSNPSWLKLGAWVTNKSEYAEVTEIEGSSATGIQISLKMWRVPEERTIMLGVFLKHWVPCERPVEPLSRYKRILNGF